jgi:predicted secreted protein
MIEVAGVSVPDGHPVLARRGDLVRVQLEENATTGYRWSVAEVDDALRIESDDFTPPGSGAAGAAGQRVVVVRPLRTGDARLVLHLQRSWEAEPLEVREIDVRTEPDEGDG